jgi:hypothetical protein
MASRSTNVGTVAGSRPQRCPVILRRPAQDVVESLGPERKLLRQVIDAKHDRANPHPGRVARLTRSDKRQVQTATASSFGSRLRTAVDTCRMGAHALGSAADAAKAAGLAAPDRPEAVSEEICWQLGRGSAAARAVLRQLPPVGENSSGPLGPGLLASGLLGTIIRDLQASLADPDHALPPRPQIDQEDGSSRMTRCSGTSPPGSSGAFRSSWSRASCCCWLSVVRAVSRIRASGRRAVRTRAGCASPRRLHRKGGRRVHD